MVPALDADELRLSPRAEELPDFAEGEVDQCIVVKFHRVPIEGSAEKHPHQHTARWGTPRELRTRKAHGQNAAAGNPRNHHPGGIERMRHAVAGEPERHDARARVVDA